MNLKLLSELMQERGFKKIDLARWLGRNPSAVTMIFKGLRKIDTDEAEVIAEKLRVPVSKLYGEDVDLVPVVGYIENGEVIFFPEEEREKIPSRWPGIPVNKITVIKIQDNSMGFPIGTLICILNDNEVVHNLVGKYCIVTTAEGKTFIRNIERGQKPNIYMLWSLNAPPVHNAKLAWAAKVHAFDLPK